MIPFLNTKDNMNISVLKPLQFPGVISWYINHRLYCGTEQILQSHFHVPVAALCKRVQGDPHPNEKLSLKDILLCRQATLGTQNLDLTKAQNI